MYKHLYAPVSREQFDEIIGQKPVTGGVYSVGGCRPLRWARYETDGEVIARWWEAEQDASTGLGLVMDNDGAPS